MQIAELTHADVGSPEFAAFVEGYARDVHYRDPDDPLMTASSVAPEVVPADPLRDYRAWVAHDKFQPLGVAWGLKTSGPDDALQLYSVDLVVLPEHRGHGVGTAMARAILERAEALGQTSLVTYPCASLWSEEGVAFAQKFGLTERGEERCSRLDASTIDVELMRHWAEPVEGFRLEQWVGPAPEHLREPWHLAGLAMDDAPLDDMEYNPHHRGPDEAYTNDCVKQENGLKLYRSLVLSDDGQPAGMTQLIVHRDRPSVAHQDDTGVLATYRGYGLGRYLKGANILHAMGDNPDMQSVYTYNAESNPWMLDINVTMGFRPHLNYWIYQGSVADAARALNPR